MKNEFFIRFISSIIILPLSLYLIILGSYFFNFLIIIIFIISVYEWQKLSSNKILNLLGTIFIFCSFYIVFIFRGNTYESLINFLLVYFVCIGTDIGGFFFGKLIGGPKITKISPNKTYAGALGGFSLSFLLIFIFSLYLNNYFINILIFDIKLIIYIFIISFSSQCGDILISYFKRLSKTKDTGKIIPGHGGILDRIDGMIFAYPISFLIGFY